MQEPFLSHASIVHGDLESSQCRARFNHRLERLLATRKINAAIVFLGLLFLGFASLSSLKAASWPEPPQAVPPSDLAVSDTAPFLDHGHQSKLGKWMHKQKTLLKQWADPHTPAQLELVTIVAGNEASDADSIITSITYGYLLEQLNAYIDTEEKEKHTTRVFIPLIKCKRKFMRLRQETVAILQHAGVKLDDLIHVDDEEFYPIMHLVESEDPSFHVVLVDHNEADGLLKGKVSHRVVEILDHHKDQEAHVAKNEIIAFDGKHGVPLVSSACTVVAEEYLKSETGRRLLKEDDGAVASALLSVIIIDSADMSQASERDQEIVSKLKRDIPNVDSKAHLQFKWLQHKKTDPAFWATATLEENLLYDFKQFEASGYSCGISSTFISLEILLEKLKNKTEVSALEEYIENPLHPDQDAEVQSTVFMIMLKKAPSLSLAVATKIPELRIFSEKFLAGPGARVLSLSRLNEQANSQNNKVVDEMDYYNQGNLKASRKQVGPTCQDMLTSFRNAELPAKVPTLN